MITLRIRLLALALLACVSTTHAMTGGPTIIRECPSCTKAVRQPTIGSGNMFGAKWWTDGKVDAPMLPMFPALVKCPHCRKLFWIADAKKLAELPPWSSGADEAKWKKATNYLDPVETDYLTAAKAARVSRAHELDARKRAWWLANDVIRKQAARSITWSGARRENLEKLSALISEKEECDLILKAETARELGQFEVCAKLLERTFNEKGCARDAAFVRGLAREKKSKVELLPTADSNRP